MVAFRKSSELAHLSLDIDDVLKFVFKNDLGLDTQKLILAPVLHNVIFTRAVWRAREILVI